MAVSIAPTAAFPEPRDHTFTAFTGFDLTDRGDSGHFAPWIWRSVEAAISLAFWRAEGGKGGDPVRPHVATAA